MRTAALEAEGERPISPELMADSKALQARGERIKAKGQISWWLIADRA